jgi:lipopolysaccharide transport system ATP-binding protein
VLAVGDPQFQKKCLGKIGDVARGGRTVLFVSHNMSAIESICNRTILLSRGKIQINSDDVTDVIKNFLDVGQSSIGKMEWSMSPKGTYDNPYFTPHQMYIGDNNGKKMNSELSEEDDCHLFIEFEVKEIHPSLYIGYLLYNENHDLLYMSMQADLAFEKWPEIRKGMNRISARLPLRLLNSGNYRIVLRVSLFQQVWILQPGQHDIELNFFLMRKFDISPFKLPDRPGILVPAIEWKTEKVKIE